MKLFILFYTPDYQHGEECDCQCYVHTKEIKGVFKTKLRAEKEIEQLIKKDRSSLFDPKVIVLTGKRRIKDELEREKQKYEIQQYDLI